MSDRERVEALALVLRKAARSHLAIREGEYWPSTIADAQADELLRSPAMRDLLAEAKADAWDEGHRTPVKYGPDNCRCGAYNEGECACGCFNSNVITPNPYRETEADR